MKASKAVQLVWSPRIKEWIKNPLNLWFMAEVKELWEEILKGNADGIREEYHDVCHHFSIWALGLGLDITLTKYFGLPSVEKTLERVKVWEKVFKTHWVEWNPSCLDGGSNYEREDKIFDKLNKAGVYGPINWLAIQKTIENL